MKKISKRILAILLSVLLVIVSLPFTAITALADNESDLLSAMTQFENKAKELRSGDTPVLFTNLSETYAKYVDVCNLYERQISDDWRIEKPTDDEVTDALSAYNTEFAKMQTWTPKTGTFAPKIGSGYAQPTSDYYANVLYSDGASQTNWFANGNGRVGQAYNANLISWDYWNTIAAFYANNVLLYDGKTAPKFPVVAGFTTGHHGSYSKSSALVVENITLSNGELDLQGEWEGSLNGYNNNDHEDLVTVPAWTNIDSSYSAYSTISNIAHTHNRPPTNADENYANRNEGKYQIYRNAVKFEPSSFNNSYMTIETTYWAAGIGFYYWNGTGNTTRFSDGQTWTNNIISDNGSDINGHDNDGNDIYIINYKKLVDAINKCLTKNAEYLPSTEITTDNLTAFREGSLEPIFNALNTAMNFDPQNDYDYSSGIRNAVAECGGDIDELSNTLTTVSPNAYDAKAKELNVAIEAYKAKINSHKLWSDMYPAYRWYITAQKYADAYKYGNRTDFDPTIDDVTTRLIAATNNMEEMSTDYSYINKKIFPGDETEEEKKPKYNAGFNNLVYAGTLPAYASGQDYERRDYPPEYVEMYFKDYGSTGWHGGPMTYLWIPYTVAVFDGDGNTEMNVPAMVGYSRHEGGLSWENNGYLYSYFSCSDELLFKNEFWTQATTATDAEILSYNKAISGNNAAQNIRLNVSESSIPSLNSYDRSDHGRNQDDTFAYIANTLQIVEPSEFENEPDNSIDKYLKVYTKMNIGFDDYWHENKGILGSKDMYNTYLSENAETDSALFTGAISIYVINYAPVKALSKNNESLLTANDFDISNYLEGGLEEYFKEMDKLTEVDPRNYNYDNDTYIASATQCATDIKNLMAATKLSPTVAPEDNEDLGGCVKDESTTASSGNEGDEGYNPDAYYTNLENVLDTVETDQGCYNNDVWQDYSDAVAAARAAMYEIADPVEYETIDGIQVPTKYKGYYQTKEVIDNLRIAIEKAAEHLTPENSHHLYRFVNQAYDSTKFASIGNFSCSKNVLHEPDTADMDVYNALAVAYDSIDFSKYASRGISTIKSGKSAFDEILLTDISYTDDEDAIHNMTPEEVAHNDAMRAVCEKRNADINAILEMKAQMKAQAIADAVAAGKTDEEIEYIVEHLFDGQPGPAQALVDSGITELLEAINNANKNSGAFTPDKHVTVRTAYVQPSGQAIYNVEVLAEAVHYGELYSVVGSNILEGNTVDYWSVDIDGKTTKFADDGSGTFETFVTNNMTITAWYTPSAGENQSDVSISNAIGNPIHKFAADNDESITLVDNNTIKVGDSDYEIVNTSSYKIDSWTANGEAFTGTKTVGELAKDGKLELKPVTHRVLGSYEVYLDGKKIYSQLPYDYHYYHLNKAEGSECLALYVNGKYFPVSYSSDYDFYANVLFENFFSIYYNSENDSFYRKFRQNGSTVTEKIDLNDDDEYRIKYKLPFTVNVVEQDSEDATKWILRATFTKDIAGDVDGATVKNAVVTEAGVLYSFNSLTAEQLTIDNVGDADLGVARYVSPKQMGNNQYSVRINTENGTRYARSYIKYQYEFNGKTISAISYGDIVICEKP